MWPKQKMHLDIAGIEYCIFEALPLQRGGSSCICQEKVKIVASKKEQIQRRKRDDFDNEKYTIANKYVLAFWLMKILFSCKPSVSFGRL
jgi:hypothetical protein